MKLSVEKLEQLSLLAARDGIWVSTSWSAWPDRKQPDWVNDQFDVASELVRLALIGAKAEREGALVELQRLGQEADND